MAEPGDPNAPDDRAPAPTPRGHGSDDHSHDDLIGFTSPASLTGRDRSSFDPPKAAPEPEAAPRPEPVPTPPPAAEIEESEPDLFDAPPPRPSPPLRDVPAATAPIPPVTEPAPARPSTDAPLDFDHLARTATPIPAASPAAATPPPAEAPVPDLGAVPAWAKETAPSRPTVREAAAFGRGPTAKGPVEGSMSLYTVYALILFAVPTLGVSALIALVAVTGRPGPEQALARSHFVFQQRTLWIAAIAAVLGVVLIAVNLGVFVLFIMAVWVVVRGAAGLLALASGRAFANPRTLWI